MRDRLRAVNCPSDMIDQIGGWSSGKVGEGYGEGFSAKMKFFFMSKICRALISGTINWAEAIATRYINAGTAKLITAMTTLCF